MKVTIATSHFGHRERRVPFITHTALTLTTQTWHSGTAHTHNTKEEMKEKGACCQLFCSAAVYNNKCITLTVPRGLWASAAELRVQ